MSPAAALEAGRAALLRGAWAEARACFEDALAAEESARGYEGLGTACRYLWDMTAAFEAHERGYRLARAAGEPETAAALALQLTVDAYGLGRVAEANGWSERALMLTEGSERSVARAYAIALRAHVAMLVHNDVDQTRELSAQALELARAAESVDVEMMALALEGLALVCAGEIKAGMRRLDAATTAAVTGEVADIDTAETICCYLIDACKRVHDLERAAEWCLRTQEIATRYDDRFMFTVCRLHHADVLIWQGAWPAADRELDQAATALLELGSNRAIDSTVRLAELRRREGKTGEARTLLAQCESHRLHALHSGLLALGEGDAAGALDAAQRFLRRIGDADRFARVAGLELLAEAAIATGDLAAAEEAATELRLAADLIGTGPLEAAALLAEGRLAAAHGDPQLARALLDDAADIYERSGTPYDAARARLELAAALRSVGEDSRAAATERQARTALTALGVTEQRRADAPAGLTGRELEVLGLVAAGRSNDEIAGALVLSIRTVEHHVASIYAKVGVSGRTARAAATAWAHANVPS